MIYSVKGELIHKEINLAVIECAGVGYACRTTSNSTDGLKLNTEVVFFTHLHVREDAVELFGFADKAELNCFKMLLTVSGVGAKSALSILSDMTPQNFALSVVADDVKRLTQVSGIGAKTAQRIILELKDKIDKQQSFTATEWNNITSKHISGKSSNSAVSALMVLGFSASESAQALSGLPAEMETSEQIKQALKKLSSGR
ncbi:MAG: Holliday junction branch migration protein RuvA [Oscillospiraceae bacterium]|nr:Holliday junction branch migration protein RuvA [Oscillospiraceae bacterium]